MAYISEIMTVLPLRWLLVALSDFMLSLSTSFE